jgi:hypothetical protein
LDFAVLVCSLLLLYNTIQTITLIKLKNYREETKQLFFKNKNVVRRSSQLILNYVQLSATDVLAPTTMKNAAKCDT